MSYDRRADLSIRQAPSEALAEGQRGGPAGPYTLADLREGYAGDGEGFDFWGTARALWRRKFIILSILILGTSAATLLTLRQMPLYKATATIEIQRQETRIMEGADVEPVSTADAEYMATQYALLKSRALAERVVEQLDLSNNPRYVDPAASREDRLLQAAGNLIANVQVAPEGRSRVVKVSFVSDDPGDAARIANTLVESFIEGSLERKYNTTSYARKFLEERLATAKTSLEEAERRLVDYAQQKDILEIGTDTGNASLDSDALVSLNGELARAQGDRILAEQTFLEMETNSAAAQFLNSPDLERLRALRSTLSAQYQELLGTFKPEYPDMVKLQARLDAVDAEMETEKALIRAATEATYRAALAREASLLGRISELKGSVQDLRERRIDYTILQREVDTGRTQYEALLQRMKEVSIAGGVGASQVSIVDKALRPGAPFEPNLRRTLLQALLLSLAAGIALALGLNYIDDTIKTPEDVKQKLALAAIGVIPLVRGKKTDNISDALGDPKSPITEAFFSARTALQFTTPSGAPRSLVLTSSRPEEGKTSSSVSLAMSFARSGSRVLIIDADLRKPAFIAPARASVGLSGLLTGDDLLENNVIGSGHDNLYLLPSGVIPPNPAELLSGARLPALVREATEMFDIVLIDSPPLLGFADAQILSSAAEATLMVIESGSIRRQVAQRALERLQESQANIIGVILTKFDEKKLGYEAGYYYYSYGKGAYAYGPTRASRKRKIRLFAGGAAGDLPPIGPE